MLSFAQNLEDIRLWQCLERRKTGFYVDIGASSPIRDSVTQLFYEAGWSGINVEPIPERAAELCRLRPRDVTVAAALGSETGMISLVRTAGIGGLSTMTPPDQLPENYQGHFWTIDVPRLTLNDVLEIYCRSQIDFLKIDAEGGELDILSNFNFDRWRPEILLLEAVEPQSAERTDSRWSFILERNLYECFFFDGINAFFGQKGRRHELAEKAQITALNSNSDEIRLLAPELQHPNKEFVLHFCRSLLRAAGLESDDYLESVFCMDRNPNDLASQLTDELVHQSYLAVFGELPSADELQAALARPTQSMRALIRQLILSDKFRALRTRSMVF